MLTVDQHARIRQLHRDGWTVGQIAAQLHHSSKTILKVLAGPAPDPLAPAATRAAPVFDPVRGIVDAILAADETAPRKQRHTAQQIFRRLVADHGYAGSYAPVQRYLKGRRLDRRETFVPLDHRPGSRAEADRGHIAVDFPGGRRSVPVRIVTWSDSNAPFALALPTERTEAILHGLVEAFGFFGCVPAEVWWDNPTTVAVHVLAGRERTVHPRYAALAAHDPFTPKFCLPVTPGRSRGSRTGCSTCSGSGPPRFPRWSTWPRGTRISDRAVSRPAGGRVAGTPRPFRSGSTGSGRPPPRSRPARSTRACSTRPWSTSTRRRGSTTTRTASPAGGRSARSPSQGTWIGSQSSPTGR
nr:transposase family protein [Fimbriiglobus ruber]